MPAGSEWGQVLPSDFVGVLSTAFRCTCCCHEDPLHILGLFTNKENHLGEV